MEKHSSKTSSPRSRQGAMVTRSAVTGRFVEAPKGGFRGVRIDSIIARVRAMSPAEMTQSLKDVGILTQSGRLAKPYRD